MHVTLPLPASLVWLLVMLPGVGLLGDTLAASITASKLFRQALTPVIGIAVWLLAVHVAGLVSGSFVTGLTIGTIAAGGLGVVTLGRAWQPRVAHGRGVGLAALIVLTASTCLVAWLAFGWAFHDEDLYTGHMSIAAEMQNDIYPPRHLSFADVPLRYHYGFDLLVACITALTRVRLDIGIDIAQTLLWAVTALVLWAIGEAWMRRGWLPIGMVLFAAGLPRCLFGVQRSRALMGVCTLAGPGTISPFLSTSFQHPWALGVPIALAALLVFSIREPGRSRPRLLVLLILLVALALGHVVLFVALTPSLVGAEIWRAAREGRSRFVALAIVAGVAIVATSLLGIAPWSLGGATRAESAVALATHLSPGDLLRWHAQSYGLLALLGVAGLVCLPRRVRVAVTLLVAGSAVVVQAFVYEHSGDIIKFGVVAQLAMSLAAAAAIARLLDGARERGLRGLSYAFVAMVALALVVVTTAGGVDFARAFLAKDINRLFARHVRSMRADEELAASFIRARVKAGETVYRREDHASGYAQWAGLPTVWQDWGTRGFGFPEARLASRAALLENLDADPSAWRAEGVRWLVLDPEDLALNAHSTAWLRQGSVATLATFGRLRVLRFADR